MAVTFGTDGTIYCNTVRYNYKQTRNLVADNGYNYGHWDLGSCSIENNYLSFVSESILKFPSGNGLYMTTQPMPIPIANHKYYGGLLWKTTGSSFSIGDGRFEWYHTDGDANNNLTFAVKNTPTNGNWIKLSAILQAGSSPNQGQWIIRNFIVNGTTESYCAKPIIIDLTECFGAGNEPTKEWCDENILEWSRFIGNNNFNFNENNVSSSMTFTNMTYGATYNITNGNQYFLNRTDIPRSYDVDMQSGTSSECYIYLPSTSLVDENTYYAFVELSQPNGNYNKSYDWYFPVEEPSLGQTPQVENGQFNSGGGLYNWKRISFFNIRSSWSSASYQTRFDFNNGGTQLYLALTNFFIVNRNILLAIYAQVNNLSISSLDSNLFNKEFCDRWGGGDCDCIIHIKNHLDKSIKFNTSYDIICNDIEIRPEQNNIYYKNDGTIVCKRLVRTQKY